MKVFMGKKPTYNYIKASFEKEGYTLLSLEYKNAKIKLNYICPKGHKHSISWNNWKSGYRCPYCAGNRKLTIKLIRDRFKKEGYKLLTTVYENNVQKLDYICPKGHKHPIMWGDFRNGKRCPTCANINHSIRFSGPNSPNWKGGISCEPYCDIWIDKDFKESIKQRDGYKCMNPDCWGTSKRLSIHHINYVKKNCNPNNLITVCTSCNARANFDREWYEAWYKAIMHMRYGYVY